MVIRQVRQFRSFHPRNTGLKRRLVSHRDKEPPPSVAQPFSAEQLREHIEVLVDVELDAHRST
jgi:hypothetical protein